MNVSHTYTADGEYIARLTVCDYLSCDDATVGDRRRNPPESSPDGSR